MADELVNLLQSIGVSDHDELAKKFAEVLQTEPAAARFFLESSNWNVEQAINTFFSTMGAGGEGLSHVSAPPPEARFLGDASITQSRPFPPGATIHMVWKFANTGSAPWPHDAHLVHTDGDRMSGPSGLPVSAPPGGTAQLSVHIRTPGRAGSHAGCWRLTCSTGYFGEPIWVVLTVTADAPAHIAAPAAAGAHQLGAAFGSLALSSAPTPAATASMAQSAPGWGAPPQPRPQWGGGFAAHPSAAAPAPTAAPAAAGYSAWGAVPAAPTVSAAAAAAVAAAPSMAPPTGAAPAGGQSGMTVEDDEERRE
eukprot:CAMPEP_0196781012 /NCGR_PEP_ID=MMETSP1104-20130614/9000_1 /TAXON_ID=33652 /ORGANISM="Cafeteria sp., Strain Caron Lab Isolate" /LENGTH=308 /DNA_ID=CAMNT_0042151229 /DNA_START=46 /DNA_END=970 /DNA_ORIENTATION=+